MNTLHPSARGAVPTGSELEVQRRDNSLERLPVMMVGPQSLPTIERSEAGRVISIAISIDAITSPSLPGLLQEDNSHQTPTEGGPPRGQASADLPHESVGGWAGQLHASCIDNTCRQRVRGVVNVPSGLRCIGKLVAAGSLPGWRAGRVMGLRPSSERPYPSS